MEGDYHRQKVGDVDPVERRSYAVDIHCRLFAVCGETALACSVLFNWVQTFSSGKQTAQSTVDGWHRKTCEAIRKLPRRWQQCLDAGGYCVELEVV